MTCIKWENCWIISPATGSSFLDTKIRDRYFAGRRFAMSKQGSV